MPSILQSRRRGHSHVWTAADVVLLAWLLYLRREGFDVYRYQRHLRQSWVRLAKALDTPDPRYLLAFGQTIAVVARSELDERLNDVRSEVLITWRPPSLDAIRREAALVGIQDLP